MPKRTHDYEWLFLDLDNTILDFGASSKKAFYHIFDSHPVSLSEQHYKRYREINHQYWVSMEKGEISAEKLTVQRWSDFLKELKIKADPVLLNDNYLSHISNNPIFVKDALESLKQLSSKYRLMLITNGLASVQLQRLQLTSLHTYFEHIVISEQLGHAKPAKDFFEHCHGLAGRPLKDMVLVIGDTLTSDIKGGLDFGYHTCWYNYYMTDNESEYRPHYEVKSQLGLKELLMEEL